jgi:hypothetical protein
MTRMSGWGGGEERRAGSVTVGVGCTCDVIFARQNPQSTEGIDVILHQKASSFKHAAQSKVSILCLTAMLTLPWQRDKAPPTALPYLSPVIRAVSL